MMRYENSPEHGLRWNRARIKALRDVDQVRVDFSNPKTDNSSHEFGPTCRFLLHQLVLGCYNYLRLNIYILVYIINYATTCLL